MAWTPEPTNLAQLAQLLSDSLNGRDKTAQKNAELTLKQAKSSPGIDSYLTYLTTTPTPISGMTPDNYMAARSAAAIMLKNNVNSYYKSIPEEGKSYIRSNILDGLKDSGSQIRNYAGSVITEMVKQGGILAWPAVLSDLIALIDNTGGNVSTQTQDGAMGALLKICEDNRKALNKSYDGQRPLDAIIPKLIDFAQSPNPRVRAKALSTLKSFITDQMPEAVQMNVENILMQLFQRAEDSDDEVRQICCRLFTALTSHFPELMIPHLGGIVDYILLQQRSDPGSDLSLDAAEFFFENCDKAELKEPFRQHLGKITPALLESMVYSEDDQARLEAEAEEDAELEDREQDIKPQFATTKDPTNAGAGADSANGSTKPSVNGYAYEEDDLSDGEIPDDDNYGEDPEEQWNLRKCSAASLDSLAAIYREQVFQVTLPYLKDNLTHAEWPKREAAVLALGAISTGCMDAVQPNLPDLTQYLLTLLNDPTSVVRQITCWTLGRYSSWAANLDQAGKSQFFEPMMEGLLHRMLDKNKKVQKAAVSAFANLEEEAKANLVPYGLVIASQFTKCFDKYKDSNMYHLYDCIQTLSENIGPEMAKPEIVNVLMPALIKRWDSVQDTSREMFPLLECLAYVASAMGPAFAPFAEPFFSRCIRIIKNNLEESNSATDRSLYEQPDKDFLVVSLDLLSAIIQALEEARSVELVAKSQPNVFELLAYCMRDTNNDVRQSAYALLGDCAICVFGQLRTWLDPIVRILILQLDLSNAQDDRETVNRVINNACWSIGEIAVRQQEGMGSFVDQLLEKLGTILLGGNVPDSLKENAAVALGRLGVANSKQLAPHLAKFAPDFLNVISKVSWTDEKLHALQGLTNMVIENPQGLEQCLLPYLTEVATGMMQNVSPPDGFDKLLSQYQAMIPDFNAFLQHIPEPQKGALQSAYGL